MNNTKHLSIVLVACLFSISVYGDFQASFTAARAAAQKKQFDIALEKYQEAANLTKNSGQRYQAYRAMAEVYQTKQEWAKAENKLNEILKDETILVQYRAAAQVCLGDYRLKQKKVDDAIAEYKKVSSFNVKTNDTRYALLSCGNLLLQQKKYDEARICFQQLLDDQGADTTRKVRAQIGIGNILFAQGKYQESIDAMKASAENTQIQPAVRAEALILIARSQYKMKAYKESNETNLAIIGLDGIPSYFKNAAYMQVINIQGDILKNYPQARKMLDEFEKMPGLSASQKKWIETSRAKISKSEHTL